jgi:hypothetical protein
MALAGSEFGWRVGIRIIPDETMPVGFKRIEGLDVFVHPQDYEFLKPLDANATLIALGMLRTLKRL